MTEIAVADTEQEQRDFASGFTDESLPPATVVKPEDPKPEAQPDPKPEAEVPEPKPDAPIYVQITQEQFDSFQNAATKTAAMEGQFSKVFGTVGEMQQVVKKLQSATPAGMTIEIPKDAFSEMEKDFPELAAPLRASLEKALKNIRGTGTTDATGTDPDALNKLVQTETVRLQLEALDDAHPTWREIVGQIGDETNEFRKWLGKQETAYQHKINSTNSATVTAKAIDKFLAAKAATATPKPAPRIAARVDRIRDAIQPKGDGRPSPPAKSADDEFREGFRTG